VTGDDPELVDPDNTVITIDHHAPADGVEAANNHNIVREFADTYGAQQYDVGDGICHQVLVEEGFVSPGDLVIGADSHSTTFGGVGGFGTGVGSTDLGRRSRPASCGSGCRRRSGSRSKATSPTACTRRTSS